MKQRWNFRCYPTPEQEQALARTSGCARFVFNRFLAERTAAFARGERMNDNPSSTALSKLKRDPDYAWLSKVSSVPTQQALRHLQTVFRNFFDKRAGYPSFKRKEGRYFVSLVVDVQPAVRSETGKSVGIDFGISRLATLSNGARVANPKYLNRYQRRLARIQKSLARKQKGSNRRRRCKHKFARIHEKVAASRKDTISKLAWSLVTRFDTIYAEDLNLRGMVKNHCLARSLSDASIGNAIRAIEAKAAMHGRALVKIDRWFPSSKMCSACGCLQSSMPLSVRHWTCDCGATHGRDENAARTIWAAGQTVAAHGDGVSAA